MLSCCAHNAARCSLTPQSMTSSVRHHPMCLLTMTRVTGRLRWSPGLHLPTPGPVIAHLTNTIKNCKSENHFAGNQTPGSQISDFLLSIVRAAVVVLKFHIWVTGSAEPSVAKFTFFPDNPPPLSYLYFEFSEPANLH